MPSGQPFARELARRLVNRSAAGHDPAAVGDDAIAAELACERAYLDLTRWLGSIGARALFDRGLAEARKAHPAIEQLRPNGESDRVFVSAAMIAAEHGGPAVAAALEAVLAETLDLLGRLVGDDMAARLLDGAAGNEASNGERPT